MRQALTSYRSWTMLVLGASIPLPSCLGDADDSGAVRAHEAPVVEGEFEIADGEGQWVPEGEGGGEASELETYDQGEAAAASNYCFCLGKVGQTRDCQRSASTCTTDSDCVLDTCSATECSQTASVCRDVLFAGSSCSTGVCPP